MHPSCRFWVSLFQLHFGPPGWPLWGSLTLFAVCCSSIGEILAYALKAFVELMEHDFVSWETLSPAFIKKARLPIR